MMKESKKKKRAKIAKKHANILLPKIDARLANGDDLEEDVDNFEDSRIELRAAGHNLTSVLMNPRVTLIDNYMTEFEADQSLPLDSPEFLSAINALHGSSSLGQSATASCTSSLISTAEYYLSSRDDLNHTGRGSLSGSHRSSTSDINSSTSSIQSAVSFASVSLTNSLRDYAHASSNASSYFTNPTSRGIFQENQRMKARALPPASRSNTISGSLPMPSSPIFKSTSDVAYCFAHVPEIFFTTDMSLKHAGIFDEPSMRYHDENTRTKNGAQKHERIGGKQSSDSSTNNDNRRSGGLYTVDLDDDDDESLEDITDREGNSSPEIYQGRLGPGEMSRIKGAMTRVVPKELFNMQTAKTLSSYLDLVEVALLRQIISRSPSFFRALDDINSLHTYVSRAALRVIHIRRQLRQTKDSEVEGDIRIPKLERRRKNEVVLNEKVQCMQRVVMGRAMLRSLLQMDDYVGALEVIRTTRKLFEQECVGIDSMINIGKELKAYDEHIAEVMANRFVSLAIEWVSEPDADVDKNPDDTDEAKPQVSDEKAEDIASFKESFALLLNSLLMVQKVPLALETYAGRLADSVRLVVRTCLLEYINADVTSADAQSSEAGGQENSFSSKVRNMTNENFLSCLQMCLESLLKILQKSVSVHIFLCQNYSEDSSHSMEKEESADLEEDKENDEQADGENEEEQRDDSGQDEGHSDKLWAMERSGTVLTSISELAQKSICQLLLMRKESTAKLPLHQIKFLWEMVLHFVYTVDEFNGVLISASNELNGDDDEANTTAHVVNLSTFPLRNGLLNQTKKFVEYLHESYKGKLVNALDNEKWLQCDVSPERQSALDVLTSGRVLLQKNKESNVTPCSSHLSTTASASSSAPKKKELAQIVVDGNSYKIVWSALLLAEILLSYIDVAIQFAPITKDVIAKTVEIITLFDSRSKQLVLGAQAIQSAARLKSIAAKHLGIMAQSLTFLNSVIPHLRAAFLSQLPPEHHLVLVELDRVSKGIVDHHSKVLQKFVSIVGDFVDASAQKLVVLDWDRFNGQSEYFEEVSRNVSALHRVLSLYLPPDQMHDVFNRIFSLLSRRIPSHFSEVMPATQTGKQRILDEAVHLVHNFSQLKHISTENLSIEEALRKKYGNVAASQQATASL